jgi:D-alanyl-D-alanine dipeptidase
MSAYSKLQTVYKDRDCLVAALNEHGYPIVETHDVAVPLVDYHGRQTRYTDPNGDYANVIVRRNHVGGAANDLGFLKQADGTYSAMVSAYDSHKHDTKWFNGLKQKYQDKVTTKVMKAKGLKLHSRTVVNGKLVVKYLQA